MPVLTLPDGKCPPNTDMEFVASGAKCMDKDSGVQRAFFPWQVLRRQGFDSDLWPTETPGVPTRPLSFRPGPWVPETCANPLFAGPGRVEMTIGAIAAAEKVRRGCVPISGGKYCCPPPGTCPTNMDKVVTYTGPSNEEANRMAAFGISVPASIPITQCVPKANGNGNGNGNGAAPNGNGNGNGNGAGMEEQKPLYTRPLFLVGAGALVVYLIMR